MNPLVSVLVPAYNVEHFLPQCLDSIVNQTYKPLQVVVIDDGSKDCTLAIAQGYAQKHPYIEVYHQDNAGVATARNTLLSRIKGEYALFVDADDWIEPLTIEFLVEKAVSCKADVVKCNSVVNDTEVKIDYTQKLLTQEEAVRLFLFHNELNGSLCNKLVKTSLFHSLKFDTRISYGEDALFCWQVFQRISRIVMTTRQLYHYRRNANSISHQSWSPDKKGTGHIVWSEICKDVEHSWHQNLGIAQARFALEDMWGLYFASLSGYKYDEHIKVRQKNIKRNLANIRKYKLDKVDRYIVAFLLSHWYGFGRVLRILK